jgi:hypothetical protein
VRNNLGSAVNKSISDTRTRAVEARLKEVMVLVIKAAHEHAAGERSRIESELRRLEDEQVRLAEQRQRGFEAARLAALEAQADRCRRSRTLVEYVAAVRAHMASVSPDEEQAGDLEAWLDWAVGQARAMDPLNEGLSDLLEVPSARTFKW